jgi:hypothetical protein
METLVEGADAELILPHEDSAYLVATGIPIEKNREVILRIAAAPLAEEHLELSVISGELLLVHAGYDLVQLMQGHEREFINYQRQQHMLYRLFLNTVLSQRLEGEVLQDARSFAPYLVAATERDALLYKQYHAWRREQNKPYAFDELMDLRSVIDDICKVSQRFLGKIR